MNKFLPHNSIPICDLDKFKNEKPSILIILAWNFSDDILNKLRTFVDWNLKCIVPLPEYKEIEL